MIMNIIQSDEGARKEAQAKRIWNKANLESRRSFFAIHEIKDIQWVNHKWNKLPFVIQSIIIKEMKPFFNQP